MAERKFPPYINAYNNIPLLFKKIKEAPVPPKFTNDYLSSILGLKSSSARALIPLLKRVEFLDAAGAPTNAYKDFRGEQGKSAILGDKVKKAYSELYQASEYAHTLDKGEITNLIVRVTGAAKSDAPVATVASTFLELVKLASFDGSGSAQVTRQSEEVPKNGDEKQDDEVPPRVGLGLSYTINLNLPPTTEIEVFNAIFKSLKGNLLDK